MELNFTTGITLRLSPKEMSLLTEARQRYKSEGRGDISYREIFMIGVNKLIDHPKVEV